MLRLLLIAALAAGIQAKVSITIDSVYVKLPRANIYDDDFISCYIKVNNQVNSHPHLYFTTFYCTSLLTINCKLSDLTILSDLRA